MTSASDPFQAAWDLARRAGLSPVTPVATPDPSLAAAFPTKAWQLACAQAQVLGFQRALNDWTEEPLPEPAELRQALQGLRRPPRGPAWWVRAWAGWRRGALEHWRNVLNETRASLQQRQSTTVALVGAVLAMQEGIDTWADHAKAWSEESPSIRAPLLESWDLQLIMLRIGLAAIAQRLQARLREETEATNRACQVLSLVESVRSAQGVAQEQAWRRAADQARSLG